MLQGTVFWAVAGARSPGRQRRWWRRRSRVSRRRGGVRARRRCAVRARGRRRAAPGAPPSWPRGRDEGGRHRMPRGGTCREEGLTHGPLGSSAYQAPSGTTRICAIIAPGSLAVEKPGGEWAPVPFTDESEQPVGSRPAAAVVVMDEGGGDNVLLHPPLCGQDRHGRTGHLRVVGSLPGARRQFSGGEAGAVLGTGGRRPGAVRSYGRGRLRAECVADAEPAEAGASAGETCRDGAEIERGRPFRAGHDRMALSKAGTYAQVAERKRFGLRIPRPARLSWSRRKAPARAISRRGGRGDSGRPGRVPDSASHRCRGWRATRIRPLSSGTSAYRRAAWSAHA